MPIAARGVTREQLAKVSDLWWLAPRKEPKKVAQAINNSATRREIAMIPNRWRNLVYYRETTGRPSLSQFVYGMARRPESFTKDRKSVV